MSWKSTATALPKSLLHGEHHQPLSDPKLKIPPGEWVTPHPTANSKQRHMLGLSKERSNDVRTPPVAQVHPNMPTRSRHSSALNVRTDTGDAYSEEKRNQPGQHVSIDGRETTESYRKIWESDFKGDCDGDMFASVLQTDDTMDVTRMNTDAPRRTHGKYYLPGPARQVETSVDDVNDGYVGRKTLPVPAQLTYNPMQSTHTSPHRRTVLPRNTVQYSSSTGDAFSSSGARTQDLTHWQQMHQVHQHYNQSLQPNVHVGHGSSYSRLPYQSSVTEQGKLDALLRVKDSLMQEKDMIIERKKMEINNLKEILREQEASERHRLMTRYYEESDVLALKLQEYQYENASLKAHITELASKQESDVYHFSGKLGETEAELEETKAALRQLALDKKKDADEYKSLLNAKEEKILELENEWKKVSATFDKLQNKKDTLEKYLEDLPTAEEHIKQIEQLRQLKDKDSILQEKISQLEKALSDAKRTIRSKDIKITALESKHSDLKIDVEGLQDKVSQLKIKKSQSMKSAKDETGDDIDELKYQRNQLNAECERLKKLIESKHSKMKVLQNKHQVEMQQLEERVQQEEDTVTALKEALSSKEEGLKKMQSSMKELAAQSQELYDHNMTLQEKILDYEQSLSSETMNVYEKLLKEMSEGILDLQGIIQICTQRAEGKDPNISMLLGLRSSSAAALPEEREDRDLTSIQSMKQKLVQIREMRHEIEKLRGVISDKYAEDIGDNCITQ